MFQVRVERRHWRRLAIVAVSLVAAAGLAYALLLVYWPFSQRRVTQAIEGTFPVKITFERFGHTHFPHPGCVAEGLRVYRIGSAPNDPPLITMRTFTVEAAYTDFLYRPGYIRRVILDGLRIEVPAMGTNAQNGAATWQASAPTKNVVGEVIADGALLEIARNDGNAPLRFDIHSLSLKSVRDGAPFTYDTTFRNAEPLGEIRSSGSFGPWNADAGHTPVQGTYTFDRADLAVFDGISGTLASQGKFQGVLGKLDSQGDVDIPDFSVTRSSHTVHLTSRYHAIVNGTNGDVQLQRVEASFLRTAVFASGTVAAHPPTDGKTTSMDFSVTNGRIQDVLWMFVKGRRPALNGAVILRAHVTVLPEGRPFLQELQLDGDFGIDDGQFTKEKTQNSIVELSERASGKNPDKLAESEADPEGLVADLSGHVALRNGVATLTNLSFQVPSARARVHGTYNLLNQEVDLHGTLLTDAKLSQNTSGVKSVLLKPFNVFFKGRHHGAVIPVKLTGTYHDPKPAIDLLP